MIPGLVLRRFARLITSDMSDVYDGQVPVSGATVEFFRQGATVAAAEAIEIPASGGEADVNVYTPGDLSVGSQVHVGVGGPILEIVDVPEPVAFPVVTVVRVRNSTGSAVTVPVGARLLVANVESVPTVFVDPLGMVPAGSDGHSVTTDTSGFATGYVRESRVDCAVTSLGTAPLLIDVEGGSEPGPSWLNVREFDSIQHAVDALPNTGGFIYFPSGRYRLAPHYDEIGGPALGVVLHERKGSVTFIGEGLSTVIEPDDPAGPQFDLITTHAGSFRIYSMMLNGAFELANPATTTRPNDKSCLVLERGHGEAGISHCFIQNVSMEGALGSGLRLTSVIIVTVLNCDMSFNGGAGALVETEILNEGCTTVRFIGCRFSWNGNRGVVVNNCGLLTFLCCSFEANTGGNSSADGNAIDAFLVPNLLVSGCFFRDAWAYPDAKQFVAVNNSLGGVIEGCFFDGGGIGQPARLGARIFLGNGFRVSNNLGNNLPDGMARFVLSEDSVVMGNLELDYDGARVGFEAGEEMHVTRGGTLPVLRFASGEDQPAASSLPAGILAFVNDPGVGRSQLQVCWGSGDDWADIAIGEPTP